MAYKAPVKKRIENAKQFKATDIRAVCVKVNALAGMPLKEYFDLYDGTFDTLMKLLPGITLRETYQGMCKRIANMPRNTRTEMQNWSEAVECVARPMQDICDRIYRKTKTLGDAVSYIRNRLKSDFRLPKLTRMDLKDFYVACDYMAERKDAKVTDIYFDTFSDDCCFNDLQFIPALEMIREVHEETNNSYYKDYIRSKYRLLIEPFSAIQTSEKWEPQKKDFYEKYIQ